MDNEETAWSKQSQSRNMILWYLVCPFCIVLLSLHLFPPQLSERLDYYNRFQTGTIAAPIAGAIVLSYLCVSRVGTLHSTGFDLAIYEQRIWLSLHKDFLGPIRFHFSPILYIVLPLFAVWPSSYCLVLCQLALYWLAVYALFLYARERLYSEASAALVACAFVLYPPVAVSAVLDFHPDLFFPPVVFLTYYFCARGNRSALTLASAGYLIKEAFIPSAALLSLSIGRTQNRLRTGAVIALIGTSVIVILLLKSPDVQTEFKDIYRGGFATVDPGHSGIEWKSIKSRIQYPFLLLAPLGFLPIFNFEAMAMALPGLAVSIFSPLELHRSIYTQYPTMVTPFLFVGLIEVLRKQRNGGSPWAPQARTMLLTMVLLTGYFSVMQGPFPWSHHFWDGNGMLGFKTYTGWGRMQSAEQLAGIVPADASVTVHNSLVVSSLVHRRKFWIFPDHLGDAQYVMLDMSGPMFVLDRVDPDQFKKALLKVQQLYKPIGSRGGFILFRRMT